MKEMNFQENKNLCQLYISFLQYTNGHTKIYCFSIDSICQPPKNDKSKLFDTNKCLVKIQFIKFLFCFYLQYNKI